MKINFRIVPITVLICLCLEVNCYTTYQNRENLTSPNHTFNYNFNTSAPLNSELMELSRQTFNRNNQPTNSTKIPAEIDTTQPVHSNTSLRKALSMTSDSVNDIVTKDEVTKNFSHDDGDRRERKPKILTSIILWDDNLHTNVSYGRAKRSPKQAYPSKSGHQGLFSPASVSQRNMARLSENISATLESLLKDYNNQIHPGFKEGKITTIKMNMLIRSMGPITEKEMKYSMDCYLRQEWRDNRLKFKGPLSQLTLNIKMLEALWKPDTYFHNGHGSYVHTITRPNKLFRIDQNGKILYSMRLTIKAKCPMELKNFPMDKQSCPLLIGSYAYSVKDVKYEWDKKLVSFEPDMTLSQYDLLNTECQNYSAKYKKGGVYSVLQVNFNFQRHTGYFLIQVYIPCILIVVLSWVSFWINREATSDRIGLCITTVLTLSTISLDSRTDLPKVHYATALDWFILMSFGYCIATLLQFAAVHYFTKVGSGEMSVEEEEWEDVDVCQSVGGEEDSVTPPFPSSRSPLRIKSDPSPEPVSDQEFPLKEEIIFLNPHCPFDHDKTTRTQPLVAYRTDQQENDLESNMDQSPTTFSRWESYECSGFREVPIYMSSKYGDTQSSTLPSKSSVRTMETQTDRHDSFWTQIFHCITGNDRYRRERTRQAMKDRSVNSVSIIDTFSRVFFPASYGLLNLWYWYSYYHTEIDYTFSEPGFDHFDHSYIK